MKIVNTIEIRDRIIWNEMKEYKKEVGIKQNKRERERERERESDRYTPFCSETSLREYPSYRAAGKIYRGLGL